jgi:hypothetical protein
MRPLSFSVALLLFAPLSTGAEDCTVLPPISDETPRAQCPARYAVSGIKCHGDWCDDISLTCCRYMPDTDEDGQPIGGGAPQESDWSQKWFSEEEGSLARPTHEALVSGLQCRGDFCDSLRMLTHSPFAIAGEPCTWLEAVSEEQSQGAKCPSGYFVNNLRCSGRYCDNLALQCCAARDATARKVVFSSSSSCVTIPSTGRGFSIEAMAAPPAISADLSTPGSRPEWICPSGFAVRGLTCRGDYCSYLQATCCPYMPGGDSSRPRYRLSPPFSEERDRRTRNSASSTTEFVVGVRCSGNYCDNLEVAFMTSAHLGNDSPACHTVGPFSEETPSGMCASYEFLSGIECRGSNCDDLVLTCCRYNPPR